VLAKQHAAELSERIGRIVERAEDRLTVVDRQRDDLRLAIVGRLELLGDVLGVGLTQQSRQLEHVSIGDRDASELHAYANQTPLEPIGLHEARHTYVSLMRDAGLSLERIGDYVGHSSKYMTDRYRHLLDGHEAEAARTLDDYLARKTGAGTGAEGRKRLALAFARSSPSQVSRVRAPSSAWLHVPPDAT
jgi:integrase